MVPSILKMGIPVFALVVYVGGLIWCIYFAKKELDYHYDNDR